MANEQDKRPNRGEGWVIVQMLLLAAIAFAPGRRPTWPKRASRAGVVAGLLVGTLGGLVAASGAAKLGSNLTPLPKPKDDGSLVEHGMYGVVRHPIYSGVILAALGWSLGRNSVIGLLLSVVLALFFDRKADHEEQWLLAVYPNYAAYRERVRKLVPWVH